MEREYEMINTIDDGAAAVAKDFVNKYRSSKKAAMSDDAIAEVGSQIVKRARIQKPAVAKKSPTASRKSQAKHTAAEVASILEITYANAHYHLRAFRKAGGDIGFPIGGI